MSLGIRFYKLQKILLKEYLLKLYSIFPSHTSVFSISLPHKENINNKLCLSSSLYILFPFEGTRIGYTIFFRIRCEMKIGELCAKHNKIVIFNILKSKFFSCKNYNKLKNDKNSIFHKII